MNASCLEIVEQIADVAGAVLWSGTTAAATWFNARWTERLGGSSERWIEQGWEQAFHPADRERCTDAWREAARDRRSRDAKVRLLVGAGHAAWHRLRFVRGDDRWFGVAVAMDARPVLPSGEQAFATISHELRAPIAALLLWERLLREHELGPDEKERALDAIHHSAVAQARLVDDLLDVARASTGKLALRRERIAVARCIARAVDDVQAAARAKMQVLDARFDADLGDVDGDATRLVQILVNLLNNAIKFTPPHGRVTLTASGAGGSIVVDIVDTGRGITPEFLPHAFEMFRQADRTLTRGESGLGVGLTIAHELATLHGGTLEASSAGAGQGARFVLRLPALPPVQRDALRSPEPAMLEGIRVLVVDDDHRVLSALELLLSRVGARVACASSVTEAMHELARGRPDVLISDLAMPGLGGFELVRRLRAIDELASLPMIALTAHATPAEAETSLTQGFDLHLTKPVDLDLLVASISRLVRRG